LKSLRASVFRSRLAYSERSRVRGGLKGPVFRRGSTQGRGGCPWAGAPVPVPQWSSPGVKSRRVRLGARDSVTSLVLAVKICSPRGDRRLTGQDDGLGIADFGLLSHGLLHDPVQVGCQGDGPGARQGQRISHVRVGIEADEDRADVRLQSEIRGCVSSPIAASFDDYRLLRFGCTTTSPPRNPRRFSLAEYVTGLAPSFRSFLVVSSLFFRQHPPAIVIRKCDVNFNASYFA
jgi:hypothetical protein